MSLWLNAMRAKFATVQATSFNVGIHQSDGCFGGSTRALLAQYKRCIVSVSSSQEREELMSPEAREESDKGQSDFGIILKVQEMAW
jgi:hypothetical protein